MKRDIIRRRVRPTGTTRTGTKEVKGTTPVENAVLLGFNPAILGLGNISLPSREIEAIATVFDLAGFTKFCNQVDPHLAVPTYLSQFLDWLFGEIKRRLTEKSQGVHKALWAELPFLAKFLGDGVLFLWNTKNMSEAVICNIVAVLYEISKEYQLLFYPHIRQAVANPPPIMRCGISRGKVFSVGNGKDYIGHCINTASRLQKLSLLTFCFPRRGFDIQEHMPLEYQQTFVVKRASIRGVGENELIWVIKEEFDRLPDKVKELFKNP